MNMKYTLQGQILSVILEHMKAALIFFIIWLSALYFTSSQVGGIIYSSISALFYFIIMYASAYGVLKNDKKSYTKLTPVWYKGIVISLGLLVLNIAVMIIYKLSWKYGADETGIVSLWAFLGNFLQLFWFSPYTNLLGMDKGEVGIWGYAIVLLFHSIACFLGYFAGYKNFDISAKLRTLMYEKKK